MKIIKETKNSEELQAREEDATLIEVVWNPPSAEMAAAEAEAAAWGGRPQTCVMGAKIVDSPVEKKRHSFVCYLCWVLSSIVWAGAICLIYQVMTLTPKSDRVFHDRQHSTIRR